MANIGQSWHVVTCSFIWPLKSAFHLILCFDTTIKAKGEQYEAVFGAPKNVFIVEREAIITTKKKKDDITEVDENNNHERQYGFEK